MLTRRTQLGLLVAAVAAPASPLPEEKTPMFNELLEASQKDKKGVMVYVKGQAIAGLVTKIGSESVELRSREYSRIVIRLAAIDAVAMS